MISGDIKKKLRKFASKEKAEILRGFFKTGTGEYGEGDIFLGIKVPEIRSVAKEFKDSGFKEIKYFIKSPFHEERLLALLILVDQFKRSNEADKKKVYLFYLKHTEFINNWDLVDLSAQYIVGGFLTQILH